MSELPRRLVHASGVGIPLLHPLDIATWGAVRWLLLALAASTAVLEAVRLTVGLDWAVYDRLTREYERDNPAGYALYAWSMAAVAFVPPPLPSVAVPLVALPGMLMLALADPVSGYLGDGAPGTWKSPGVLAVTFGFSFALALPFCLAAAPLLVAVLAAAAGATGATLADGYMPVVSGYVIDDNATIAPLGSGGVWVVLWLAA